MEVKKLIKSASVMDRILKILQGFLIAGMIVSAVFIPLTAILGEKIIADASSLNFGNLTVRFAGDPASYLNYDSVKLSIILTLIAALLACAAGWYCLRVLRQILSPMKEGRPFENGIAARVRKLAWTVLIGGGIVEFCHQLSTIFNFKAYRLEELFQNQNVAEVSTNLSLRLWFVGGALLLFFLSYVFRRGEDLQKESDETL